MQHDVTMFANHADEQPETVSLGNLLGTAGIKFLSDLVNAKKSGAELPSALDKVATIAIQGESKAIDLAKSEAKKEATNKAGWIVASILIIILLFMLVKNS